MRKLVKRPSPSMAVAITALVAAVGGTAIATPIAVNSVLNKQEKKQTKSISKNQANLAIDQRAPSLTVGTANSANTVANGAISTAKLADGAVTAPKLANISNQTDSPSIPATTAQAVLVDCDPGGQVVSGGWFISPGDGVQVTRSRREDDNTWAFTFNNTDATANGVDAIAICVTG